MQSNENLGLVVYKKKKQFISSHALFKKMFTKKLKILKTKYNIFTITFIACKTISQMPIEGAIFFFTAFLKSF